ncbi:uncharacterized protein LOC115134128 isoform X1 [Oncorhynchus nerka]|uniref:Uncharacterized LOC109867561 n=3 Tax=Salmoninae TaxID=504568 RepID=A0A8C7N1E2_ONCKI|nr:uncharacterized protein LOC110497549 [Oncorhynchus mykiss]XP_024235517.1 uncharacterized protein LOC112218704 isoform X1 [Oncorhynchus tshawytscha]XP_029523655.1 uncharacterized protein LOC115134128 isoform X1 [Oncorhynchus nerka]XP_031657663.1 uncharacterized protein LOC109867561 [Oncorhynchus kisutch]XP_035645598.1 uncharacterized protein LOC118395780 [Oncorhynchus keta]XP_045544246.1 uncharacterized protein LOC106561290 isoform X1 [Salmo salar]XP_046165539.1 uncharacterized protein LOC1|eukprot:XP_013980552.1 PREDICTED: uncharacterized protein LOC106561290 isoform X1 [Salmo salar]
MMEAMDKRPFGSEYNYKMSENDISRLIKLRATNDAIFTGKRNSAMPAWRAMLVELGLEGKLTTGQLKKKWENLKKKYKDFKYPPLGMEKVNPMSWRWFHLMDDAIEGRLSGSARILNPSLFDFGEVGDVSFASSPTTSPIANKRLCMRPEGGEGTNIFEFWAKAQLGESVGAASTVADGQVAYTDAATEEIRRAAVECERALREEGRGGGQNERAAPDKMPVGGYGRTMAEDVETIAEDGRAMLVRNPGRNIERETAELERQIADLEKEREVLEREQADFDRERLILDRERDVVNRERVAVERGRASLDKDRAAMDRERAAMERERAILDRDRASIERERTELQKEKEALMKSKISRNNGSADVELDSSTIEKRERLLSIFERLVDKL